MSVSVVNIVRIVIKYPVTIVVASCRPEDPVTVDVVTVVRRYIEVPVIRTIVTNSMIMVMSVRGMSIDAPLKRIITIRTVIVASTVVYT